VDIGIDQRLLHLRVTHNDELPGLGVRARHRPAAGLENLVDIGVGHRVRPQIAHAHAASEQFAKLLVFGCRLFVSSRHHWLPGEPASPVASGAEPAGIVLFMANVVWVRDQANARRSSRPRTVSGQNGTREDQMKHHPMGAGVLALVAIWAVAFASTAAALDRVRVGKAVPFAWTFTPIDVGIAVGIFAKHGLELEVTGFAGDARLQQGLVSDSIDCGLGSGAGMGFLAKGVPAKAVAAMAGAPMNMSMVASYDSPIKTLTTSRASGSGLPRSGRSRTGCSSGSYRKRNGRR